MNNLEKSEYVSEMEHTILYKKYTRKTENHKWEHNPIYDFYVLSKITEKSNHITHTPDVIKHSQTLSTFFINTILPLINKDNWTLQEVTLYREDMFDSIPIIVSLLAFEKIDTRQARMILEACWKLPYLHPLDYIYTNLDIFTKKDITPIIEQIISENTPIIEQIKNGNQKAIGSLIGKALKLDKSINPKEFSEKLIATINS